MTNMCEVVSDLLPLYRDKVCSASSMEMVEKHLSECEVCRGLLARIEDDTHVNALQDERLNIIKRHNKKVKRSSFIVGACVGGVLTIPIIVCLIVNLATGHTLDWFFIVLTSLMLTASVTVVPLILEEKKFFFTIISFTVSLILLLLTCNIYSRGDWFFVAATPVLFGLSVLFLPFVLRELPLKAPYSKNIGLLTMAADSLLLYAVVIVSGLYAGESGNYFREGLIITTHCVLFVWIIFSVIRYLKLPALIKAGTCLIVTGFFISTADDIFHFINNGILDITLLNANLSIWDNQNIINANIRLIMLAAPLIIGIILIGINFLINQKKHNK